VLFVTLYLAAGASREAGSCMGAKQPGSHE
jgi:hypothetical protein